MAKKHRTNCPSSTWQRGKVNAHVRDYAGFEDIGGDVKGSGWEGGSSTPKMGTDDGALQGSHGSSKDKQESK